MIPVARSLGGGGSNAFRSTLQVPAFAAIGLVAAIGLQNPGTFARLAVAAAAAVAAIAAWRYPVGALCAVAVGVSFQALALGWLYRHGVAPDAVRYAGYWKEGVLVIVGLRAWHQRARTADTADRVELLAIAYLAVVLIYVALPLGGDLRVRYIAARADAGFVVLFLIARSLVADERQRARFERLVVVAGTVVGALGLWNYFDPAGWTEWIEGMGTPDYIRDILGSSTYEPVLKTAFGDSTVTRVGSIFLDPIGLAYFLLVTVAVAANRLLRGVGGGFDGVAAVVCVLGTCLTFTRSAIAVLPVLVVVLAVASGRLTRYVGPLVIGTVALALVAGALGVGDQVATGFDTSDPRTASHLEALGNAVERVASNPFGSGLGTVAGVGERFEVEGALATTENFYLQVAIEIGLLGAAVFAAFVVVLWRFVLRRARVASGGVAVAGAAGLACLALGGLALHTFANLPVTWVLFVLLGLDLGANRQASGQLRSIQPAGQEWSRMARGRSVVGT